MRAATTRIPRIRAALTSVTAQQTGFELGKRSRFRWETFPSRRSVSGAITWQGVDLNDASRKSWPCLPLHDSPLMTDRDAMSERGSIPSWYEDRCELRKYGVTGSIGFPDNPELSGSRRNNRANGRFPLPHVRVARDRWFRRRPGPGDTRPGPPMRYSVVAAGLGTGSAIPGDWLSGRAPRSHRGGHWFDPSIAHQV